MEAVGKAIVSAGPGTSPRPKRERGLRLRMRAASRQLSSVSKLGQPSRHHGTTARRHNGTPARWTRQNTTTTTLMSWWFHSSRWFGYLKR